MGRIPRPGDLLLALAVALLIAATVHQFEGRADSQDRRAADVAAFAGYAHAGRASRARLRITRHRRWDVVCSRRLCVHVKRGPAGARVILAYNRRRL
jgi:hypothetical protein